VVVKVGVMLMVFILIAFAIGCFVVRRYVTKLLRDLYHLSVQVAEADTTIGEHMVAVPQLRSEINGLRLQLDDVSQRCAMLTTQVAKQEVDMEALSDRQDGLHFGLVEVGGYVRTHDLTPAQRRHMYTQERGNLVARTTMGTSQYLRTIRAQSRGYTHGEDTDPPVETETAAAASSGAAAASTRPNNELNGENAESSNPTSDMEVDNAMLNPDRDLTTRGGELEATIDDLRTQLDDALASESWDDAAELQHTILILLDPLQTQDLRDRNFMRETFNPMADRMEHLSRRVRRRGNGVLADQYMDYATSYRNSM